MANKENPIEIVETSWVNLLFDFQAMTTHQTVAVSISLIALAMTITNFLHTWSIKRSEWILYGVSAAAETVSIADDTISLAGSTKLVVQATFQLSGSGGGSREKIYTDQIEAYKSKAISHREIATEGLSFLTKRWWFKRGLVHRVAQVTMTKYQMASVELCPKVGDGVIRRRFEVA